MRSPWLLLLTCVALFAHADPAEESPIPWYRVELIVFAQDYSGTADEERWSTTYIPIDNSLLTWLTPKPTSLIDTPLNAEESSAKPVENPVENVLPAPYAPTDLEYFKAALERLQKNDNISILYQGAWLQPGWSRDAQQVAYIRSDSETYQYVPERTAEDGSLLIPEWVLAPVWEGTIAVARERYLHAQLNITLRQPSGNGLGDNWQWHLKENRRMRSNEPHYLDHPKLGAMIIAIPYEFAEHATEATTPTENRPTQ